MTVTMILMGFISLKSFYLLKNTSYNFSICQSCVHQANKGYDLFLLKPGILLALDKRKSEA